ncbi:MAG: CehA/McbA family metallohydrolase [Polyangiaceae bacterium]
MRGFFGLGVAALALGCSSESVSPPPDDDGTTGCLKEELEVGDPDGHPDPFGAKAAGQARAGRLVDIVGIPQPIHGRQAIEPGDFVLANEHIAVVIEDKDLSDGYGRFGGEVLAIDRVGEDGQPLGQSSYVETLLGIGFSAVDPTSVTVLHDGSDGGEAAVRVIGVTKAIPFIGNSLGPLFGTVRPYEVALDYVLDPGAESFRLRMSLANRESEPVDFGEIKAAKDEIYGFFQGSHNQLVTAEYGFALDEVQGFVDFAGYVGKGTSFAWRAPDGPLSFGIEQSGFVLFQGPGWLADACAITTEDRTEVIVGEIGYDSLREAMRRVDGAEPWRAISGRVLDDGGAPLAGAHVHVRDLDNVYLSRTVTDASGNYTVHAPPGESVSLQAQLRGYLHDAVDVGAGETSVDLSFLPSSKLVVNATWNGAPLPVRVQVIPTQALPATPPEHGVLDEVDGRLHQEFAVTGTASLVVPPGEHRVLVSRGYEWELSDQLVTVAAGESLTVDVDLERSVDTTGVMCADFHIHSFQSADSPDPIDHKVKGAIADGLDIPVSSEHEWVVDFQPVIESLGLTQWAFGMPSSELTTFEYGHFGVVPLLPQPGAYNNGAIDWVGKTPAETFAAVDERPEKPALIVNHPSGTTGFQAYFTATLLDEETGEPGKPDLWSENFDAVEVFNDSGLDQNGPAAAHFYGLLNKGRKLVAIGSSDSHKLRTSPVGFPRTCFPFGHDDPTQLSASIVRDAVLSGNSVVTGGLFMTVAGPGGAAPGGSVSAGAQTFDVTVQTPSWIQAQELEVIVRGVVVTTIPLTESAPVGAGRLYEAAVPVTLAAGDWVMFHARGAGDLAPLHPGKKPFAVSNPIYVGG